MGRSFWNRRTNPTIGNDTSRPSRLFSGFMTIAGIVVIGLLFFGVFWGARWSFDKLADSGSGSNTSSSSSSQGSDQENSNGQGTVADSQDSAPAEDPSVTVTSSTSTTTPNTSSSVATVPATTERLPHTGPASTTAFFVVMVVTSYLLYRKKLLKNQ